MNIKIPIKSNKKKKNPIKYSNAIYNECNNHERINNHGRLEEINESKKVVVDRITRDK